MRFLFLSFAVFLLSSSAWAKVPGFQTSFTGGYDFVDSDASRDSAPFISAQLGTRSKFLRFHGAFTLLKGGTYLGGEGAVGISLYPISNYVGERASVHPFLTGQGVAGVSRAGSSNRQDAGYSYGAGVDLQAWRRGGFTLSAQQFVTTDTSMRYALGLYWFRESE